MSYVAAGVAVGGAGLSYIGSQNAAGAAGKASAAMQDQAHAWQLQVAAAKQQALSMVNTPSQIAAYDQALQGQEANVRRQESLVASLDPNIIEAGKQTMQLLQGHSAPVLANLQQQRDIQKQKMLDGLRTQMGPGAETSSAGQQAIQQFDQQTANIMNDAQQQYLDKVSNMSMGGAATLGQTLSQVHSTLSSMQTQSPGVQAADLIAKFTGAEAGAQGAQMEAAGGQFAGAQIQGQSLANIGNAGLTLGAMFMGKQMAGGGTQSGTPDTSGAPADQMQMSMGTGATPQQMADYQAAQSAQAPTQGSLASTVYGPRPAPVGYQAPAASYNRSAGVGVPAQPGMMSPNWNSNYQDPRYQSYPNSFGSKVVGE